MHSPSTAALVGQGIDMDSIMRDYESLMNTLTHSHSETDDKPASSSSGDGSRATFASAGSASVPPPALPSSSSGAKDDSGMHAYSYTAQYSTSKNPGQYGDEEGGGGGGGGGGRQEGASPVPPAPPVAVEGMGALLSALREADRRASLAKEDVAIAKAEGEAALADSRLDTQRLQRQLRALTTQRGLEEVYGVLEEEAARLTRELGAARAQITALEERASSAEARAACRDIDREITATAGALHISNASSFASASAGAGAGLAGNTLTSFSAPNVSPMRMNGRAVAPSPGGGGGEDEPSFATALDSTTLGRTLSSLSSSSAAAKKEIRRLSARIARYVHQHTQTRVHMHIHTHAHALMCLYLLCCQWR